MTVKEEKEREGTKYLIIVLIILVVVLCLKDGWDSKDAYNSSYKEGYQQAIEDYGIEE